MAITGSVHVPTHTREHSFTKAQLEALWIASGGPVKVAPTAAAIALAESEGFASSTNYNTNGTVDRGLWQINSVHGSLSTTNVTANAKAAVQVYKEAHGSFSPWVTYKTGAYKAHLGGAGISAGERKLAEGSAAGLGKVVEEGQQSIENWFSGPNWFKAIAKLVIEAVLLLAGALLVIYGVMVAVRPRESALSIPLR